MPDNSPLIKRAISRVKKQYDSMSREELVRHFKAGDITACGELVEGVGTLGITIVPCKLLEPGKACAVTDPLPCATCIHSSLMRELLPR